eukprot:1159079-Pelagomonas_calceolata.AAC.4
MLTHTHSWPQVLTCSVLGGKPPSVVTIGCDEPTHTLYACAHTNFSPHLLTWSVPGGMPPSVITFGGDEAAIAPLESWTCRPPHVVDHAAVSAVAAAAAAAAAVDLPERLRSCRLAYWLAPLYPCPPLGSAQAYTSLAAAAAAAAAPAARPGLDPSSGGETLVLASTAPPAARSGLQQQLLWTRLWTASVQILGGSRPRPRPLVRRSAPEKQAAMSALEQQPTACGGRCKHAEVYAWSTTDLKDQVWSSSALEECKWAGVRRGLVALSAAVIQMMTPKWNGSEK